MNGLRQVDGVDLIADEHRIPSGTDGIELFIRSRRPTSLSLYTPEKTIVMVHGATFSSGSLYDVPLNGLSFLDFLAMGGYDVHAVDVRGFGHSSYPQQMQEPARAERPVVDTEMGVRDFATAVDFVRNDRQVSDVNVFGMSWGGSVAGAYTSRNSATVRKLALLAPQWLSTAPIPLDPGGPLETYRLVPVNAVKTRWLQNVPESGRATLIPQTWFEQWARATLAEDPWSVERTPEHIRATTGPIQDIRDFWAVGRPLYEPSAIAVPTLLVHGEWDFDVPIELAQAYFRELTGAPYRRCVEIGEATHFVLLEKNRLQAFQAVRSFFDEHLSPES